MRPSFLSCLDSLSIIPYKFKTVSRFDILCTYHYMIKFSSNQISIHVHIILFDVVVNCKD